MRRERYTDRADAADRNGWRASLQCVVVLLAIILGACEDAAPTEYIPQVVVEAFLIVDEPVDGIRVTRSQSVADTFRYERSAIADADVKLIAGDRTYQLAYRSDSTVGEYYLPDTSIRIEPLTTYRLVVTTPDGTVASGETRTKERIAWIKPPREILYYPQDTVGLPAPDSIALSWTALPDVTEYVIAVTCLDTLGYGRYLDPPTDERNRRMVRFFEEGAPFYDDVTRTGFIQGSGTPVSWFAFKWFGRQEVVVYAADQAFVNWYKMTHFQSPPTYQPLLGNVTGGLGVVASASAARREIFVMKNQP